MVDLPNVVEFREKIYQNLDISTPNNFRAKSCSVNDVQKWTGFVDELRTNNNPVIFVDLACFIYCQPEQVKLDSENNFGKILKLKVDFKHFS